MNRKYADRSDWGRIVQKQLTVIPKKTVGFSGYLTLFEIQKVTEPLYKQYEQERICVAGDGYKWMQHFPEYAHFTLTSMYDEKLRIVQWTITICKSQGVSSDRVPWYDDLHLQIVILPSGRMYVINQERLEEAVKSGELGRGDYELAWNTANQIMEEYRKGSFDLLLIANKHFYELLEE